MVVRIVILEGDQTIDACHDPAVADVVGGLGTVLGPVRVGDLEFCEECLAPKNLHALTHGAIDAGRPAGDDLGIGVQVLDVAPDDAQSGPITAPNNPDDLFWNDHSWPFPYSITRKSRP